MVGKRVATPKNFRYNRAAWVKISTRLLRLRPVCEAEGCFERSRNIDHIKPIAQGGAHYDIANLQALCLACHRQKTEGELGVGIRGKSRSLGRSFEVGLDGWGEEL